MRTLRDVDDENLMSAQAFVSEGLDTVMADISESALGVNDELVGIVRQRGAKQSLAVRQLVAAETVVEFLDQHGLQGR